MTREDWQQVIDDITQLGIPVVPFIGNEPALAPCLPAYIDRALEAGLQVEVYSNLTHVRPGPRGSVKALRRAPVVSHRISGPPAPDDRSRPSEPPDRDDHPIHDPVTAAPASPAHPPRAERRRLNEVRGPRAQRRSRAAGRSLTGQAGVA